MKLPTKVRTELYRLFDAGRAALALLDKVA